MEKSVSGDTPLVDGVIKFPFIQEALKRITRGEKASTPLLDTSKILRFWLWGSDANEVCEASKCEFHQMHLVGMVCTRVFAEVYQEEGDEVNSVPVFLEVDDVKLLGDHCSVFLPHFHTTSEEKVSVGADLKSDNAMDIDNVNVDATNTTLALPIMVPLSVSLQQMRDLVYAIQTQWPLMQRAIDDCDTRSNQLVLMGAIERLITQLFVWFGGYLFEDNIQAWQADDTEFIHNVPPTHAMVLTDMGIKFYLNIFFILFRLLFIQRHAVTVPKGRNSTTNLYPFAIETFHVEAGVDDFHMLGMYFDIPAGCLLEYKHSYSGYYNNVSQCVYRHFPSYKRRFPLSLVDIELEDSSDLAILPALKQIYPEIEFAFEDHHFQRDVGSVRVPVLLSQSAKQGKPTKRHTKTDVVNQVTHKLIPRMSDALKARISACSNGPTTTKDVAVEGGTSTDMIDWYWFVIGGDICLVCVLDGAIYKGHCRDLLAFYLTLQ
jgi:hypothetical protein